MENLKNIRLLVDCHLFDEHYQGTRTYIKGIYSELIKRDLPITYYLAAHDIDKLKKEFGESPKIHYVRLKSTNRLIRLGYEFHKIIKENKIDYAHYQYIAPLFKSCKEITTIHDILFVDYPEYFPKTYILKNNLLFKRSAKRADILLTVSEYSRKAISKHYKIDQNKINIVPSGIPKSFLDLLSSEDLPDIKTKYGISKFLLYVSRLEPRKNHLQLLKAFMELRLYCQEYFLIFIGKNDFTFSDYHDYMREIPENERKYIIQFSDIDNIELAAFYKTCDLFVYPSFAEGFGLPPIEALASGAPVLSSNATAMGDLLFLEDDFFDPTNLDELKNKMSEKLSNPRQSNCNQQEFTKKHFNFEAVTDIFADILWDNIKKQSLLTD